MIGEVSVNWMHLHRLELAPSQVAEATQVSILVMWVAVGAVSLWTEFRWWLHYSVMKKKKCLLLEPKFVLIFYLVSWFC